MNILVFIFSPSDSPNDVLEFSDHGDSEAVSTEVETSLLSTSSSAALLPTSPSADLLSTSSSAALLSTSSSAALLSTRLSAAYLPTNSVPLRSLPTASRLQARQPESTPSLTLPISLPQMSQSGPSKDTSHTNPNWLTQLQLNFQDEVIQKCSDRTKKAVENNENIEVCFK